MTVKPVVTTDDESDAFLRGMSDEISFDNIASRETDFV
jgi:hypothetical protein